MISAPSTLDAIDVPGDAHLVDRFEDGGVYFTARTPLRIVPLISRAAQCADCRWHSPAVERCQCPDTDARRYNIARSPGKGCGPDALLFKPKPSISSASPSGGSASVSEIPLADRRALTARRSQPGDDLTNNNRDVNRFHGAANSREETRDHV